MAERESKRIAHDILGEPHIHGRRISVRQMYVLVEEHDEDPAAVADRFDLEIADVYHALAYYHDHPEEMRGVEAQRTIAVKSFQQSVDRPAGIDPDTA